MTRTGEQLLARFFFAALFPPQGNQILSCTLIGWSIFHISNHPVIIQLVQCENNDFGIRTGVKVIAIITFHQCVIFFSSFLLGFRLFCCGLYLFVGQILLVL